jgi:hypothetical protein
MQTAQRSGGRWRWRIIWFGAIVGGTLALFPCVRSTSEQLRRNDAATELAQMQKMLAAYRDRNKVWPAALNNQQLVQAFLGRLEPRAKNAKPRWYLGGTDLHFRPTDPEMPQAQVIDPWGRPYGYFYRSAANGEVASYVLFSAGADGRYSSPLLWHAGQNGTAPEDADNICVFSGQP